jgi:hypothetical protein
MVTVPTIPAVGNERARFAERALEDLNPDPVTAPRTEKGAAPRPDKNPYTGLSWTWQ